MDLLRLTIPQQTPTPAVAAFFNAAKLGAWLDALPMANPRKTGEELLAALHKVNRATAPANQRFHLLEQFRPLIADISDILHKHYSAAAIPLDDKNRVTAELNHALLGEMAFGYKAVLLATADTSLSDADRNLMVASALHAMHHLARLLVDSYALYSPEPKSLWLELHQLYRYAEYEGFLASGLPQESKHSDVRSIDHTYRRILMLALANPYHLMQGEALLVFRELDKWASHCRILPLAAATTPTGQLYLDLDSDAPPTYAPMSGQGIYPMDGRVLDITGVLAVLERRGKELMVSAKTPSGQLTLAGRKLRNMYKRLAEAWGIRVERLSERKPRSNPIEIAIGISAAHHFACHGAEFAPESNEIALRHRKIGSKGRGLRLMGENDTPWVNEDQAQRLATGIVQPRTSQFAADPVKDKDVWVKIYSTQAHHEAKKNANRNISPTFENTICQLHDESRGGMAMTCQKGHGLRLVVGEVIAFKSEHAPSADDWSIGVVRWLRTDAQEKLAMGIGMLADDTLAVASRGIKGVGKDSEYFRSLLIPKLDPTQYPTTLITPAAVFDMDSIILVNTGTDVFYAQLTRLMDSTNSFSLFQYKIVDAP